MLLFGLFAPVAEGVLGLHYNYFQLPQLGGKYPAGPPLPNPSPLILLGGLAILFLTFVAGLGTAANNPVIVGLSSVGIAPLMLVALFIYDAPRHGYGEPLVHLSWGCGLFLIGEGLLFAGGVLGEFPPAGRY